MKKIVYMIFAAIVSAGFCACSDSDDDPKESMSIARSDSFFYARGGTGSIEVANGEGKLTAETIDNWCKIISVEGNTVKFEVPAIVDISSRTTEIVITSSNGESKGVPITQQGAIFLMEEVYPLELTYEGGNQKLLYKKNNTNLTVIPESLPDWIECRHEQDGLWVIVDRNTQGSRTAEFLVSVYNEDQVYHQDISKITIVQGSVLSVESIAGTWKMEYTWYPEAPGKAYTAFADAVATSEARSENIELVADPNDSTKFTATIGGYPIRFELDPVTSDLMIPSEQRDLGDYTFEGTQYYPVLIQFGFNKGKPTINMGTKGWLTSESSFVDNGSTIKTSLKFVKGGTWNYATGYTIYGFAGPVPGLSTLVSGRVISIYENIVLTREF